MRTRFSRSSSSSSSSRCKTEQTKYDTRSTSSATKYRIAIIFAQSSGFGTSGTRKQRSRTARSSKQQR
eukprot:377876-Pyramimonas_sp.AAC.2